MLKSIPIILLQLFVVGFFASGQSNTWIETNTGIGSAGEFEVVSLLVMSNGDLYSAIRNHSAGEEKDGIYQYNPATEQWEKLADRLNQYGYSALVSSGNRIFGIPGGNSQTLYELNLATGEWEEILEVPDYGLNLRRGIDAVDNKVYLPCRIESDNDIERSPARKFRKNEEFVVEVDADSQEFTLLRNPENPLIIGAKGGNPTHPIALKNGKIYHYSTFEYRDKDGTGGLYEWDGNDWNSASYGLDAINITGSGFGPIGPIYTDVNHEKLFIRTEQGFFEKTEGGWFKYFYRTSSRFFISPDFLFVNQNNGSILKVDRAVRQSLPSQGVDCIETVRKFVTPNNSQTFFAEMEVRRDNNGNCSDDNDLDQKIGIYRYVPDGEQAGTVKNLHLENGTYLGGRGSNFAAESSISASGKLLVAGIFHDNMGVTPTTLLEANSESTGKVYVMNQWGTAVEQTLVLGEAIDDMDIDETTGEVALLGDFGVAVLNADFSLKWNAPATAPNGEDGSYRPRVSLATDGKVVAVVQNNDQVVIRLYAADGDIIHNNTEPYDQSKKVYDIEISSDANHQQYYVCGFTQANANLQVAYLHAYDFSAAANRNWRTWGFSVGGSEGLSLSDNGADTRAYRIKAHEGGNVYVAGESAGGGPGGFSIFAYNGKDLTTKVAHRNNDFFTDGTNSSGANHITFLARINPSDGVVQKGKFFHGRLSNGKTNTHRVKDGDLEVDADGNIYVVGKSAFQFQDRDVFNVNGSLIETYSGGDLYVLMTSPDMDTRWLWGAFPKNNRASGDFNRIAVGQGKVAFVATTSRGEMMTTDNAPQPLPYNISGDTLSAPDVYLATWQQNVWETANNDPVTLAFIPDSACFRVDDVPCSAPLLPEERSSSAEDIIQPFNTLTPNGDGRNDTWRVDNLQVLLNYSITVFTKVGQVVFESDQYRQNWDGTWRGRPLPPGTYYYQIAGADKLGASVRKTGFITLIR